MLLPMQLLLLQLLLQVGFYFKSSRSCQIIQFYPPGVTTCAAKGRTKKVVLVNKGESYQFKTNEAAKYGANVRCLVTYKRRGSCKKMKVSCDQFSLATGDTLRVQRGRNKQT